MNAQTTVDIQTSNPATVYPETAVEHEVYYPSEIKDEMGETAIHYKLASLLFNILEAFFASQEKVAVAAI